MRNRTEYNKKWKANNPNYFKDYYLEKKERYSNLRIEYLKNKKQSITEITTKQCRKCKLDFTPTLNQLVKSDYICRTCYNENNRRLQKTQKRQEYYKNYRATHKDRKNEISKIWRDKNDINKKTYLKAKIKNPNICKEKYLKYRDRILAQIKKYRSRNRDLIRKKTRECSAILKDAYIKKRIKAMGIENPTPEMIEQKRLTLKIKRKIKQLTK